MYLYTFHLDHHIILLLKGATEIKYNKVHLFMIRMAVLLHIYNHWDHASLFPMSILFPVESQNSGLW